MRVLIQKELRAQLPFMWLVLFITVAPYVAGALTKSFGLETFDKVYGEGLVNLGFEYTVISFLICLGCSYGLLVREIDDRTIEFLDALPVSRTQLFVAKWMAVMAVLSLFPIVDSIVMILIRRLSATSLDRSYHFDWIATSMFLQWLQLFCFLSIGLMFSFFRRFGWLLLGLTGWFLMILGRFYPQFQLGNLTLFSEAQFIGLRWLVPWDLVAGYVLVGVLCLLVSYGLFLGGGRSLLAILTAKDSIGKQILLYATSFLIVLVLLGMMTMSAMDDEELESEPDAVRVHFPSWSTATRTTHHYNVVFPSNLSVRANELLDHADGVYQTVAHFFQYEGDTVIQIDMTSSSSHHLGTAYWNKLKMDLTAHEDLAGLQRTLGHETTHVILESLSDNHLRENFGSVRFFHEGVATYVERRFFTDEDLADQRLAAAVLKHRDDVSFDRLVDNEQLRREHDTLLAYELGEVFAAAIVSRCGDEAIGRIAHTFADKQNYEGLTGVALWRSIFQSAGYSLNEVVDEYYTLLSAADELHSETVTKLAEIHPIVQQENGKIRFQIDSAVPEGWKIIIRFRASSEAADDEYWQAKFKDGIATTSANRFVGRAAWYQIGYQKESGYPISQPWQSIRLTK